MSNPRRLHPETRHRPRNLGLCYEAAIDRAPVPIQAAYLTARGAPTAFRTAAEWRSDRALLLSSVVLDLLAKRPGLVRVGA